MASVISDANGRKRLQFVAGDGSRKTLRLGKATVRQAESIKVRVEQLALAATGITGVIDDETAKWLTGLDEVVYGKLAAVGLVAPRTSAKLGAFIDAYIAERTDVKSGTATFYGHLLRPHAAKSYRLLWSGKASEGDHAGGCGPVENVLDPAGAGGQYRAPALRYGQAVFPCGRQTRAYLV